MTDETLSDRLQRLAREWDEVASMYAVEAARALTGRAYSDAATACHRAYQAALRADALRQAVQQ